MVILMADNTKTRGASNFERDITYKNEYDEDPFGERNRSMVKILKLDRASSPGYFTQIAHLHTAEIHFGFLPLLGEKFLFRLYYEMADIPSVGLWVAEQDELILGFLLGSSDFLQSYRMVLRRGWFRLTILGFSSLFKKDVLQKLPSILSYPLRPQTGTRRNKENPLISHAELLSIAISSNEHRHGIGRSLVRCFEEALKEWGIKTYFVTTNSTDQDSNSFYQKMGFISYGQRKHNDLILQVYKKTLLFMGEG